MGLLSDSEIFMFDNPSFDINGRKYFFFVIILGYLYGKGKGYRKYRKGPYRKKPRKSYRKAYHKYRGQKGYYPKKGKGYGYRYGYRHPY